MAPQPASIQTLADYLVSGFWTDEGRSPHRFDTSAGQVITFNTAGLAPDAQSLARLAIEAWEMVAPINFQEVATGGQIIFGDDKAGAYASSYYSQGLISHSLIEVSANWVADYGNTVGTYGFQTYMHEIGHAMGLGHAGSYNGSADFATDARFQNDSWQLSVMSYFSQTENPGSQASYAILVSPMIADILAIQQIYGQQAGGPGAGDTLWGLGSSLGNYLDDLFVGPGAGLVGKAMTIYDSSGIDGLDFSNDWRNQRVDLNGGAFSDVYGERGNLAILPGSVIENYVAGSGNDRVSGNAADNRLSLNGGDDSAWGGTGNDSLDGGAGEDRLEGGTGDDTYMVNSAADRVIEASGAGTDLVNSTVTFRLGEALENLTLTGGVAISGIGNALANIIAGNGGGNRLEGAGGIDRLVGASGDDHLLGGTGNDDLGGDVGNDVLEGAAGADHLDGGAGKDVLVGGKGADRFVFAAGSDRVADFRDDTDTLVLDDVLWSAAKLSVDRVISRFATEVGGDVVFTFAKGVTVRLDHVANVHSLADDLQFI